MCCLATSDALDCVHQKLFPNGTKASWNQSITLIHFGAELIAQSCSLNYAICLVRTLILRGGISKGVSTTTLMSDKL